MGKIILSVIIVSWNVKSFVLKCLKSIYDSNNLDEIEIILIDNNSNDNTTLEIAKFIKATNKNKPYFKLIHNLKNIGFSRACNQGIKISIGKYILLLNPDTIVFPDTFKNIIEFAEKNPECGIIGGKVLNPDYTIQPSIRRFPNLLDQIFILLKFPHIFKNLKCIDNYLCRNFDYNKPAFDIDQVQGAFFLIKKDVIQKIGILDENFWIWFEEVDFCKRVKSFGFKICYTPLSKIIHYKAKSFIQILNFKRQKMFNKSLARYFKKHKSIIEWLIIKFVGVISLIISIIISCFVIFQKYVKKSR